MKNPFKPDLRERLEREIRENQVNAYNAQRDIEYAEAELALANRRISRAQNMLRELDPEPIPFETHTRVAPLKAGQR